MQHFWNIFLADITFYVTCNQLHVDTVSQIVKLTKHNDIDDHLSPPNQQSVSKKYQPELTSLKNESSSNLQAIGWCSELI